MRHECYFCHTKTIQNLIAKFEPTNRVADDFVFAVHKLLGNSRNVPNPQLATEIHSLSRKKLNVEDLYASEKNYANTLLLEGHKHWKNLICTSTHPFSTAVKLAVIGNIIDYGAHSVNENLMHQINGLLETPLTVDKTNELKQAVKSAKSILYLGDNAGEVFFDRLLIETIKHPNVTFVTRGAPVINDITMDDARQVGMNKICKVINNGYRAPSTLLPYCSDDFLEAYHNADLIISKGQGNFEGLMEQGHPNTFFLLIAKCKPMANMLGCNKNDMVVTKLI